MIKKIINRKWVNIFNFIQMVVKVISIINKLVNIGLVL
jgi:hypothetical protein